MEDHAVFMPSVVSMCVEPGDVLRFVKTVVAHNKVVEEAMKCVKVINGVNTCTVGFVSRNCICLPKAQEHLNKFVQVERLYHSSKNPFERSNAAANYRVASV